ncbi:MAG: hypothetical protein RIR49_2045 [Actinomycetota bacterium]|jgi:hypothetical protein
MRLHRSDDRGTALVSALVTLTAITVGSVLWLARDVDTSLSIRSTVDAIAFQAARSGAQQLDVRDLRGATPEVRVDPDRASRAARSTARRLLVGEGLRGEVIAVSAVDDRVRVTVRVDGPVTPAEATATAVAERG